jgi:hypothetical protein
MPKAKSVHSTPRRTASSSQKSSPKPAATAAILPVDPVVELAKKLMNAWDADNCADAKYPEAEPAAARLEKEASAQLREWRSALETLISYSDPASFQGALVQMALGLETLNQVDSLIEAGDKEDLSDMARTADRLLCSAMRVMLSVPGQEIDEDVKSIVNIYVDDSDFVEKARAWSETARADRKSVSPA